VFDKKKGYTAWKLNSDTGEWEVIKPPPFEQSGVNWGGFFSKDYSAILKVTVKYNERDLSAYLPIGLSYSRDIGWYVGPDTIIYNSNGVKPSYYFNDFNLYTLDGVEYKPNGSDVKMKEIRINGEKLEEDKPKFYLYPNIDATKKRLQIPDIYIQNNNERISILFSELIIQTSTP
jgi:hypothetical protein